jgi:hypothetical protein
MCKGWQGIEKEKEEKRSFQAKLVFSKINKSLHTYKFYKQVWMGRMRRENMARRGAEDAEKNKSIYSASAAALRAISFSYHWGFIPLHKGRAMKHGETKIRVIRVFYFVRFVS